MRARDKPALGYGVSGGGGVLSALFHPLAPRVRLAERGKRVFAALQALSFLDEVK
jgi:hypothetical protein